MPGRPSYEYVVRELERARKALSGLTRERDFLNTLLETIPVPVFFKDAEGRYTGCNRAFEDFIGRTRQEIIGKTVYDIAPADLAETYSRKDLEILQTPRSQTYQWKVRRGDGATRDVIFEKAPLFDNNGVATGLVGTISDITERIMAEAALRDSEERYHALADATFEAVFISEGGICIDANKTAAEMFGYTTDQMIGMRSTDFIAPESRNLVKKNMLSRYEEPYKAVCQKSDGATFHAEIRGKMAEYHGKIVRITIVHNIDDYVRAAAALKASKENLQDLSSSLMAAQERERQWIAYTMHDEMAQDLVVLTIELKMMDELLRDDQAPLKEACRRVKAHVVKIIENIRRISHELSPVLIADLGLTTALQLMIEEFTQQTGILTQVEMENVDRNFSPQTDIIVYRIFQEALANIRKHAGATRVRIAVQKRTNDVYVSIEDNGRGFATSPDGSGDGPEKRMGLLAMEERARMIGSPLRYYSITGQGTRIVFRIPVAGN